MTNLRGGASRAARPSTPGRFEEDGSDSELSSLSSLASTPGSVHRRCDEVAAVGESEGQAPSASKKEIAAHPGDERPKHGKKPKGAKVVVPEKSTAKTHINGDGTKRRLSALSLSKYNIEGDGNNEPSSSVSLLKTNMNGDSTQERSSSASPLKTNAKSDGIKDRSPSPSPLKTNINHDDSKEPLSSSSPPIMARQKRKRATPTGYADPAAAHQPPYVAASADEKRDWAGFCEIESEPAIFNNIISSLGISGVRIQEVFSLEPEILASIPSIHGLIFLFHYMDKDAGDQTAECPPHVWFGNQVVANCCATMALVNMANNVPESAINLGPQMSALKTFAYPFSPAMRGEIVANAPFIRHAHNAYARKLDMLLGDAALEEEFTTTAKKRKQGKKLNAAASRKKAAAKKDEEDTPFHFAAYMPIANAIYRLDGLDAHPQHLGDLSKSDNWLDTVAPLLQERMADFSETGIMFSMMAMVPDTLVAKRAKFVANEVLRRDVEAALDETSDSWCATRGAPRSPVRGTFALTDAEQRASYSPKSARQLAQAQGRETELLDLRDVVAERRETAVEDIEAELRMRLGDEEMAVDRQNDYGPFLQHWVQLLAENGRLKDVVDSLA